MTACLIGGTLVSPILARTRVTAALRNMFAVAAASLLLSAGAETYNCLRFDRVAHFCPPPPLPTLFREVVGNLNVATAGFMMFEVCCGLFWPLMGMQRSETIPEDIRSTVLHVTSPSPPLAPPHSRAITGLEPVSPAPQHLRRGGAV